MSSLTAGHPGVHQDSLWLQPSFPGSEQSTLGTSLPLLSLPVHNILGQKVLCNGSHFPSEETEAIDVC